MLSKKILSASQAAGGTPVDRYYNISYGTKMVFNPRKGGGDQDVHMINSYWGRSLIGFTYTAAELSGCGLVSGAVIKKLRYFANEINSTNVYPWPNYAIAMCHIPSGTNETDPLTSSTRTNFTTVKAQHNFTPPNAGSSAQTAYRKFIEFTLDTNFTWNGTDAIGFIFAHGTRPNVSDYSGHGIGELVTTGKAYYARDDASGTYTVNDTAYTSTSSYAGATGNIDRRPIVQMYATQDENAGNYGNVPLVFSDLYSAILHGYAGGSATSTMIGSDLNGISNGGVYNFEVNASDDIHQGFEVTPYIIGNTYGSLLMRPDMARHVPVQSASNNVTNHYWKTPSNKNNPTSAQMEGTVSYDADHLIFDRDSEATATVAAVKTNLTNVTDGSVVFLYKTTDTKSLFLSEGPNNSYQNFLGAYSNTNGYYNDLGTGAATPSILLNNSSISSLYSSARTGNWDMLEFRGVDFSDFSSSQNIGFNDYYGPAFRFGDIDLRAMLIFKNKLNSTTAAEVKTYFEDNASVY